MTANADMFAFENDFCSVVPPIKPHIVLNDLSLSILIFTASSEKYSYVCFFSYIVAMSIGDVCYIHITLFFQISAGKAF